MPHPKIRRSAFTLALITFSLAAAPALAIDWQEIQSAKKDLLNTAAQHAMEQQKRTASDPLPIPFPENPQAAGGLQLTEKSPKNLSIKAAISPNRWQGGQPDSIRLDLPKPLDMLSAHSGLRLIVHTEKSTSPEIRIGARLTSEDGKTAEILPAVLLTSAWNSNPHEIYLDWAFINYADNDKPAPGHPTLDQTIAVLKNVKTIELTFGGIVRAPERGASKSDQPAEFQLSDLALVDYLKGSYDPDRHSWKDDKKDLTLQHRVQEVTGIVIKYGGQPGLKSGLESLDLCARTQCWDGSFLDGRRGPVTVTSGEYTFGFTIYGTVEGYMALRDMKAKELQEKITIGPDTLTRDQFYQRIFYRAAMARAVAIPSKYRDDIIGGDTLMTGANRVLGYAIAMRMVGDILDDPRQKAEVLAKYQPIMQEIADAQGRYSGGFPLLGEGDKYQGKGIHYDAGYTRTHMDVLVAGVHHTGDPLLVQMLTRYQTVFEALMDSSGTGIVPMISERHPSETSVALIIPDLTAQVGLKYHLPIIAQWGYNDAIPAWKTYAPGKSLNHFTYIARVRGYPLGAHSQVLTADTQPDPAPKDLGYLFPRQYPIWSARIYNKNAPDKSVRISKVTVYPDGRMTNDFKIDVGEFPFIVGVPVSIKSPNGNVTCEALELTGWPKLLPADAPIVLTGNVDAQGKINQPIAITLDNPGPSTITFTSSEIKLSEEAGGKTVRVTGKLVLTPEKPGQKVEITFHNGTVPYDQKSLAPDALKK